MTHKTTHITYILCNKFDIQKTFRQQFLCMLHYAFSKIVNVFGSFPKKLNVFFYVFSSIDG